MYPMFYCEWWVCSNSAIYQSVLATVARNPFIAQNSDNVHNITSLTLFCSRNNGMDKTSTPLDSWGRKGIALLLHKLAQFQKLFWSLLCIDIYTLLRLRNMRYDALRLGRLHRCLHIWWKRNLYPRKLSFWKLPTFISPFWKYFRVIYSCFGHWSFITRHQAHSDQRKYRIVSKFSALDRCSSGVASVQCR